MTITKKSIHISTSDKGIVSTPKHNESKLQQSSLIGNLNLSLHNFTSSALNC